jgi:hypothetical protein
MLSHCHGVHSTCGVLACHGRLVLRRVELGQLLGQVAYLALGLHTQVTQASQTDALGHQPPCGHNASEWVRGGREESIDRRRAGGRWGLRVRVCS